MRKPPELLRERADRLVKDLLVELARDGTIDNYRLEQRFAFEAPDLREAVELAGQLRELVRTGVQIRPRAVRVLGRRRWRVVATTPPVPVLQAMPNTWREQMLRAADRRPRCTLVEWEPVLRTSTAGWGDERLPAARRQFTPRG